MHILIASVGCFLPVYLSQVGHVFRPVLFDTFAHPPSSCLQSISSQSDKSGGATEEERESGGWNKTDGPRKEGEGEKGAPGRETCVDCGRHRRRPVREV